MLFIDYTFTKAFDDNIIFDKDLKPEQLNIKEGDRFIAKIINNAVVLVKEQNNE